METLANSDGSIRIDTSLDNSGFEKGSEKMRRATVSLEQTISRAGENIHNAASSMFDGVDTTSLSEEMRRAELAVEKAELKLKKAQQAFADFAQQEMPTDSYKQITSEISKTEAALLRLYDRRNLMEDMGVNESTAQWQRLQLQIDATERKLDDLESTAETMRKKGDAFISPKATARFQELALAVEDAKVKLDQELSRAVGKARSELDAMEDVEHTSQLVDRFKEKASSASQAISGFMERVSSAARAVGNLGKRMAKAAWDKIKSGVKSVASHIKNIGSHSRSSTLSANSLVKSLSSLKNMMISRIKRTFVSYLQSELSNAMKELAKFDSAYDTSISNMRNRTTELSANITASLGTLIKTIEPYITAAINAASNAMAKISAILAALRGEKTVTVAKKQTASYADSLSDSAKSASDAAKAQKKLNATLSSYDQLHKLESNDNASASGAADTAIGSDLFETVSVDSVLGDVSNFGRQIVESIKESIAKGDWYGAGAAGANGLNTIAAAINGKIVEIRPKAEQLATNLAQGLNGLTENMDGYAIGNLLADGINLAFGTVNAFITTYNWGALGKNIGESINGLFLETDWNLIGETFGNGFNSVVDVLYNAVTNIKWRESGEKVGQGLNKLFKTVDWAKLGATFGESVKGVLGFLASAIEEVDWLAFGEDVKVALQNVDWDGISDALFELIGAAFGGIFAFLSGLLGDAIESLADWWNSTAFTEEGEFTLEGLYKGLIKAAEGIIEWVDKHIVQPFIDGFKKALGIHSPSTVMAEQGGYIIQGLLNGITEKWSQIPSWLFKKAGELVNGIKEKWDDMKTTASQKFSDLKTTLVNKLNSAKTALGNISFKSIGENIVSGLKNGIKNTWNTAKSTLSGLASSLADGVKDVLDIHSPSRVFMRIGEFVAQGLNNGIVAGESEVMRSVSGMAENMIDTMQVDTSDVDLDGIDSRMLSGLNQVAARFEAIARAFAAIDKALTSMGGMPIPQMATGTVIPAKVAIADSTRGNVHGGDSDAEMIGLMKKIIALIDGRDGSRPNGGTRVPIEIITKIDRREIAKVVKEIDISNGRTSNGRGGGR